MSSTTSGTHSATSSHLNGSAVLERQSRVVSVIGVVLLVGLTVAAVLTTRRIVRAQVDTMLESVLATTASGINVWYADQTRYAERLSRREALREHALAILENSSADRGAVLDEIDAYLAKQFLGIMVVNRDLTLEASSQPEWKLDALPADVVERLRACLSGEPVVVRPVLIGSGPTRRTVVLLGIPARARSGAGTAGALLLAIDPMVDLKQLLDRTWPEGQGESFMASQDGIMLVGSRPFDELRQLGVAPTDATPRALGVRLVDPGRRLSLDAPRRDADGMQPTPMAAAIAAGRNGGVQDGVRDYRGEMVIARWRWLPDLGVGLVCKLDRDYAYRPIHILEGIFLVALVMAAAGMAAALVYFRRSSRALRRAWEVQRRIDDLDRYVIGAKIGEGAMGSVHRATHARLRRPAAIKIIRAQAMTPENTVRFEREAQMTCRLAHPNTVKVFDYGALSDGSLYYVMEYLEGMSLQDLVRRHGAQPPGRVVHLLVQALGALAEAHRLGLIHRDIKPSNLYLAVLGGMPDVVKLLDFGLARDHGSDALSLTRSGTVMGSPTCMPPETIERSGRNIDARADLYSIACVGYWLLTGHNPFEAESLMEILHAHLHQVPKSPSQRLGRSLPADLEAVIMRGLAKTPEERHASADEFRAALLACACAGTWSDRDAREWWQRVDPGSSASAPSVPTAAPVPIAIDHRLPQSEALAETRHGPTEAA